jgi:hypothetical protein
MHPGGGGGGMRIRHSLVILLGGLLSAGTSGCSTVQTVIGSRSNRNVSADRMVAVGKVFENQGRYDAAEAMYRSALRQQPQNPIIQQQLSHLQIERSLHPDNPDTITQALQLAQSVPVQQTSPSPRTAPKDATVASGEHESAQHRTEGGHESYKEFAPSQVIPATADFVSGQYSANSAALTSGVVQVSGESYALIRQTDPSASEDFRTEALTGPISSGEGTTVTAAPTIDGSPEITLSEVMIAVSAPDEHFVMLLQAARTGDCAETQSFAAALLGECDVNNFRIRDELCTLQREALDPGLQLAIADTQIHRGEANEHTAETLSRVASCSETEYQVQAITGLRHFAGTTSERQVAATLRQLLRHHDPAVRSSCAVTLGDFVSRGRSTDEVTLAGLSRLASTDENEDVRVSARAALLRRREASSESAEAVIIRPAAG